LNLDFQTRAAAVKLASALGWLTMVDPRYVSEFKSVARRDDFESLPQFQPLLMPKLWKRFIDVCVSAVLLILLAPLFLFVSLLIKATSSGPVFYVSQRIGYLGTTFMMYRFRTMVVNADKLIAGPDMLFGQREVLGPVFKIKEDPRITPAGRFLRRTSIDEVPQLINVLLGQMSLIGPSPLTKWQRRLTKADRDDSRFARFLLRPGVVGLFEVTEISKPRLRKPTVLEYTKMRSTILDIHILLIAFVNTLRGSEY
jgi:lipopolysaccharide/colanic/teichoic acid biosynthesis glycosyltransferase